MLTCPECNDNVRVRMQEWRNSIDAYISDAAFQRLLEMFGFSFEKGNFEQRLVRISSFVKARWDYRNKAGRGERWTITDVDPLVTNNEKEIVSCARKLGMIDRTEPDPHCDYIIVLGGARAANMNRVLEARTVRERQEPEKPVIGLSALRLLGEIEKPYVKGYVDNPDPSKTTEYDVMCAAMEKVFSLSIHSEEKEIIENDRNRSWIIRNYGNATAICAPSSDPDNRRANTADTLEFFLRKGLVPEQSVLHFMTSSIYINYQMASLMPIAFKYNLKFLFSGNVSSGPDQNAVTSNYLQEIKASIDAICRSIDL